MSSHKTIRFGLLIFFFSNCTRDSKLRQNLNKVIYVYINNIIEINGIIGINNIMGGAFLISKNQMSKLLIRSWRHN